MNDIIQEKHEQAEEIISIEVPTEDILDIPDPAVVDLLDPSLYINRELSMLQFQRRVLDEAMDSNNPLLERVKFLTQYW